MATKLYLHAAASSVTGTLPSAEQSTLTPDANFFTGVSDADNKTMNTTIGVSQANLTNTSTADTNAHNYYVMKWVSPLIYQGSISANTWTVEYGAKEANAAANFPRSSTGAMYVNCYVWKPSDGTKVGTILDGNSAGDGEEAGTTQTVINYTFTGAAVTGLTPGDAVIVYELWAQVTQGNGTARVQDVYYDGTTENSTTNEAAFLSTPENLQFTPTAPNATIIQSGGNAATSTANTTQYWPVAGNNTPQPLANEAFVQIPIRTAGVISNLSVVLSANTITGTTTFTLMKNGSTTSLVANATATGANIWEDLSNTATVAAGDLLDIKSVPGAATNTFTMRSMSMLFTPTDTGVSDQILGATTSQSFTSNSSTNYIAMNGTCENRTTEANSKSRQRQGGTYQYFAVYVSANARTSDTTFKLRKNGSDTTLLVTYTSGQTGLKEDTSHSFTVASGDDVNVAITTGAGSGESITYEFIKVEFLSDPYYGFFESGRAGGSSFNANTTNYIHIGGHYSALGTESQAWRKIRSSILKVQDLFVYVSANTVTADSTVTLMVNGIATSIVATLTNATTGLFSDTTNTATIGSNDVIDFKIVTGATGTSLTITNMVLWYQEGSRISLSSSYKYNIIGRISLARNYLYNVLGRISQSDTYKYNIVSRVTQSRIYKYNILNRVSLEQIYKYHLLGRVSQAKSYLYNVVGRISLSRIYKYNTSARVSLSRIYKYHVANLVSLSRTYKYHILSRVSLSRSYLYHILGRISLSRIYKHNLIGRISQSSIYKYHVLGRISLSSILKYNVLGRISLSRTYLWDVIEEALERISKPQIYKYNVIGRVSLSRIYLYNILGRVSLSRSYLYNVVGRISLSRIYKYHIQSRVALSRIYKYNVLSRVTLSRIYKYHMLGRVSLSRVYKYNLIGRISKTQTYLWNVISGGLERISKEQIYKYNIIGRVSLAYVYKYNILGRVSLSRAYLYNVQSRVSLARNYLFHVVGRISLSRTYKYHIVNRISLSRNYLWHITTLVSQSSIFKYNVLKRISLSRIFRWDFDRIPTTRGRTLAGNLESKQLYPKRFDRIRSYFYNSPPTKHRRNSKYTRG